MMGLVYDVQYVDSILADGRGARAASYPWFRGNAVKPPLPSGKRPVLRGVWASWTVRLRLGRQHDRHSVGYSEIRPGVIDVRAYDRGQYRLTNDRCQYCSPINCPGDVFAAYGYGDFRDREDVGPVGFALAR